MSLPHSLQARLGLSLGLVLTLLWIAAAWATSVVLRHEMGRVFDSALQETAQRILPLAVVDIIGRDEDHATQRIAALRTHEEFFTYILRDADGQSVLVAAPRFPEAEAIDDMGGCVAPMPGKVVRELDEAAIEGLRRSAEHYAANARRFSAGLSEC